MENYTNEDKIGMRYYKFINDDEFTVVILIHKNKKDKTIASFMNEETFEIAEISKNELVNDWILFTEYNPFILSVFKLSDWFKQDAGKDLPETLWYSNYSIANFIINNRYSNIYTLKARINMVVYKYMKKSVFFRLIESMIKLANGKCCLDDCNNINGVWEDYFNTFHLSPNHNTVPVLSMGGIGGLETVIDEEGHIMLSDGDLEEIEETLDTCILSYEMYEYNDSIDLSSVSMRHFFIYTDDNYYIVLYIIDTERVIRKEEAIVDENKDLVNFMLMRR